MPEARTFTKDQLEPIPVRGLPVPDVPKRVLANAIRDRIERGVYKPSSELPSLVALEKMTGVARGTIRAALKILSDEGYLRSVIGLGSYVLPREYWGHPEKLEGK